MKEIDKSLEIRIYRLMGEQLIDGMAKAERIIQNYEFHGYDVSKIRSNVKSYIHSIVSEYQTKALKRREN